ncbi:hypothetical protein J6590_011915 [Homalodisca vitripennis]|nr:hypothetical protein J6590_011915 [Homalodisca vitripennis]
MEPVDATISQSSQNTDHSFSAPKRSVTSKRLLPLTHKTPIAPTRYLQKWTKADGGKAGKVRAKKPSLPLNLGTNGLKVTSEPPPMVGQAGRLQGQDRSAVTYPSSGHARRCL